MMEVTIKWDKLYNYYSFVLNFAKHAMYTWTNEHIAFLLTSDNNQMSSWNLPVESKVVRVSLIALPNACETSRGVS